MSKVRVLKNEDNTVSVIIPAPKSQRDGEAEEQWISRVFGKATPKDAIYKDISAANLPSRESREAWEFDSINGIAVNSEKEAVILAEKVRRVKIEDEKERLAEEGAIVSLENAGKL